MNKIPLSLISGLTLLSSIILFGYLGPIFIDVSNYEVASVMPSQPPSNELILGSDSQGRDMLSVTIYSIPQTIKIAVIAGFFGIFIGLFLGLLSGYIGGNVDTLIRITSDSLMTVPGIAILIIIATNVETMTVELMGLTIACIAWMHPTRTIRSQVLTIRENNYIKIARANGLNNFQIIFFEILPNLLPYIAACLVASITGAILATVGLESLGLGTQDDHTLGTTIYWARRYSAILRGQWWWWGPPIAIISLIFVSLFLISLGLDKYSNPKLSMLNSKKRRLGNQINPGKKITTENVLEIDNLTVEFEKDGRKITALNKISLKISENQIVGLIGESGSGKSTLANTILSILPDNADITSGNIIFDKKPINSLSDFQLNQLRASDMSLIPQAAMNSLNPVLKIKDQLLDSLAFQEKDLTLKNQKITNLLNQVGLDGNVADKYPHQLSGGMKQRVTMAMAISHNPKLIIADEPTSALDVVVQKQVMKTLKKIQQNLKCGMILIGHDLGLITQFCDDVVVLYEGRIVEFGSVEEIIHNPKNNYTQHLIDSLPKFDFQNA